MSLRHRVACLGVTALLTAALSFLHSGTADAADRAGSTVRDVATGLCLDSNTSRQVYTLGCNGGNFQHWALSGPASSTTLKNVATGFCLDSNTSGQVYTLGCNGGNFQHWVRSGRTLRNVSTGFCLDSNTSGRVYTLGCNGGNFQNWNIG